MAVLNAAERKLLERVVVSARGVVESACGERVRALGVAQDRRPGLLSEGDARLRVALRARARQLGSVEALVAEAGFEQWHRMLFARVLVDNGLLVDDVAGMPVSWADVVEAAAEYQVSDPWELAASWAGHMLPGIFRSEDPVLQIRLPVEARQGLERLLAELPVEVTTADDALGWVYQYWQSQRKDEVNRSERKIGGADLAPVTQLFTEDYMVRFLLENSLGAWWAARHPDSPLVKDWEFLRFGENGSPAAGSFEGWPERAAEVTVMDPCCGSGHFLTAAFGMLWRMRVDEEGLDPVAAQDAVLRDNLFGLELDARCTQIAVFALAVQAWKDGSGYRELPVPNVACSGIPAKAPLEEWTALAGGDARLEAALARLHALFADADTLGSLIDPRRAAEDAGLESVDWHEVAPLVQQALTTESKKHNDDPASAVFGEAAAGIARAADYLSRHYTLIATNVPYLGRGRQSELLQSWLEIHYPEGMADLATGMLQRFSSGLRCCLSLGVVVPENWLNLRGYSAFRQLLLRDCEWRVVGKLGAGAFSAIPGEVVKVALLIVEAQVPAPESRMLVFDLSIPGGSISTKLKTDRLDTISQRAQYDGPESRVLLRPLLRAQPLGAVARPFQGIKTGDNDRYTRRHWEVVGIEGKWRIMQTSPTSNTSSSGRSLIVWCSSPENPERADWARVQGLGAWGQRGVAVSTVGGLWADIYDGVAFDSAPVALVPHDPSLLPALLAFCRSAEFRDGIRTLDSKVAVTTGTFGLVPFDAIQWGPRAAETYPDGLPEPFSDDPTQWLFKGDPVGSTEPLQVAVGRLLGFRWPDQEPDALDGLADDDGVVCLPAVGGEEPAADRVLAVLAAAYGEAWNPSPNRPSVLDGLLADAGAKRGAAGLERWLRDGFFKQHCKVFANRPFVWQIWDGRPDGFSALVMYHKLDRRLLERLTYDYLGNWWVGRQRDEARDGAAGAEARLAAALALKEKLELILQGEPPYDVYVRWKALAEQPMGWDPDLDDGVRLNIRPFMAAGVLRAKPNIHWKKDRGKNPDGSERHNDLHYTLAEKRAARESAEEPGS